jgi:phage-related minor tail protein
MMGKQATRLFWAVLAANLATIIIKSLLNTLLNALVGNLSFGGMANGGGSVGEDDGMMAMHFDIEGKEENE